MTMLRIRAREARDVVVAAKAVNLQGGVRLSYVETGNPGGPPVILLHGYTDSLRSFDLLLPHLPASYRVVALSQRGHGDASRPPHGYRPRDFAADLAAFMDALGIQSAVIVGHSMGSQVALRFAIGHAARVAGLVLIGGFASLGRNPVMREFYKASVAPLSDPIDADFAREFQESTLANPVPPAFLDTVVAESLKVPARVWRGALAGQMEEDVTAELRAIHAPTLLLWGDRDALVSRGDQDALVDAMRNAVLVTYARIGHAVHWEAPGRVGADLTAFVDTVAA
ncbi:MAG TPA: alpha/beta hydrolase [Alphaproteobacteria bacterium]|nr:alpha/beta hydrolase [Alphaproteobacteria bacterium]